ncbi:MAG: thioredoxin family protein [Planctomycetales bacterium]|nr:thioredoxin family protein [Planctomycetales bacterium]
MKSRYLPHIALLLACSLVAVVGCKSYPSFGSLKMPSFFAHSDESEQPEIHELEYVEGGSRDTQSQPSIDDFRTADDVPAEYYAPIVRPASTTSPAPDRGQSMEQSQVVTTDAARIATAIDNAAAQFVLPRAVSAEIIPLRNLGDREDLRSVLAQAPGNVLLDFTATWCGPCKIQAKVLHEVEGVAHEANAQIIKVDFDKRRDLAKQFGVSSLPTLVLLRDGQEIDRRVGLSDRSQVESMLLQ